MACSLGVIYRTYCRYYDKSSFANAVNPDLPAQEQSEQGLHYLPFYQQLYSNFRVFCERRLFGVDYRKMLWTLISGVGRRFDSTVRLAGNF